MYFKNNKSFTKYISILAIFHYMYTQYTNENICELILIYLG